MRPLSQHPIFHLDIPISQFQRGYIPISQKKMTHTPISQIALHPLSFTDLQNVQNDTDSGST